MRPSGGARSASRLPGSSRSRFGGVRSESDPCRHLVPAVLDRDFSPVDDEHIQPPGAVPYRRGHLPAVQWVDDGFGPVGHAPGLRQVRSLWRRRRRSRLLPLLRDAGNRRTCLRVRPLLRRQCRNQRRTGLPDGPHRQAGGQLQGDLGRYQYAGLDGETPVGDAAGQRAGLHVRIGRLERARALRLPAVQRVPDHRRLSRAASGRAVVDGQLPGPAERYRSVRSTNGTPGLVLIPLSHQLTYALRRNNSV